LVFLNSINDCRSTSADGKSLKKSRNFVIVTSVNFRFIRGDMALKGNGMGKGHLFVEYLRGEGAIEKRNLQKGTENGGGEEE
jgi:hypothetical protein